MGYYIDQNGNYYEGDKAYWQDQDVPQRPDANGLRPVLGAQGGPRGGNHG